MKDLLLKAQRMQASDLHLTVDMPPFVRIHGEIVLMNEPTLSAERLKELVYGLLTEPQIKILQQDLEYCLAITLPDAGYFRVTLYYHRGCVEASVRIGATEIRTCRDLGLPPALEELTRKPSGLILITGPTGAGKTTTLNALVDQINRERRCKIVMVEDPIEYVHRNVKSIIIQQEIRSDTHSFSRALVHILRQDPDAIGIGEMRDLETMSAALTAAETGHLVMATLHSTDCPQTISRIVDVFPDSQQQQVRVQLGLTLRAIVNLRLLRRADGRGRILAYSMLVATPAVANLIRENKLNQIPNVMVSGKREGMVLMDEMLKEYYQKAMITYEVALAHMSDPSKLTGRPVDSLGRVDATQRARRRTQEMKIRPDTTE